MEKWEVQSAVDTLQKAEELRGNPQMMKKVEQEVAKRQKALSKVAGGERKTEKKAPAKTTKKAAPSKKGPAKKKAPTKKAPAKKAKK